MTTHERKRPRATKDAAEQTGRERQIMACPYCHETVEVPPSLQGPPDRCPHCTREVLSTQWAAAG